MLAHGVERQTVNINVAVNLFQKTACCAHLLYNKMPQPKNDVLVIVSPKVTGIRYNEAIVYISIIEVSDLTRAG